MEPRALLIYKQRHFSANEPKTHASNLGYTKYIGTRQGVMTEPDTNTDYTKYIGNRPGVMNNTQTQNKDTPNGFFGKINNEYKSFYKDQKEVLNRVNEISNEKKTMFRSVISFTREQADNLGLYTRADWIKYTKARIFAIARENGIDFKNFEWIGAVHNKQGQPHVHINFWDKSDEIQKQFINKEKVRHLRGSLIKETYPEYLKEFYESKKISETALRKNFNAIMETYEEYLLNKPPGEHYCYVDEEKYEQMIKDKIDINSFDLENIYSAFSKIKLCIPKHGRLNYQFLTEEIKEKVDTYVELIIKSDKRFKNLVNDYVESKIFLAKVYTSNQNKLTKLTKDYTSEANKIVANIILKGIKQNPSENVDIHNFTAEQCNNYSDIIKDIFFSLYEATKMFNSRIRNINNYNKNLSADKSKEAKKERLNELKDRGIGVEH